MFSRSATIISATLLLSSAPVFGAQEPAESFTPPAADERAAEEAAQEQVLTRQQTMQAEFHLMAGEMAAGRGQHDLAAEAFLRALENYPDPDLARRATQLALSSNNPDLARRTSAKWLELEPNALDAREVLARMALAQGDIEETYAQCLEIINGHPGGRSEGFRHAALILSADPSANPAMLDIFDRLVAVNPEVSGGHYARALIALRLQAYPEAEASVRKALEIEPKSQDYQLLLVGVLVRADDVAQADSVVRGLLKQTKGDQRDEVRQAYARLLLEAGHRNASREQFQQALKENPKNNDARYALGIMALTDSELDEAQAMFEPLSKDPERASDAHYQLGRIAESRREYEKALRHYEKVHTGALAIESAVRQATVKTQMGRVNEARVGLQDLRRRYPPLGPRLILAEAEILMNANLNAEALSVYGAALEDRPGDIDLLYGRSLVHERSGDFDSAEADLRSILAQDGEDARALNALGYMLVVNTDRYEEAHKLIGSALDFAPDDAAVIDSKGWVLFKLGRPTEARSYLEKALAKTPDPEISAHLGEVLWTLGEHEQAREVWNKALIRDPDHAGVLEAIERLTR